MAGSPRSGTTWAAQTISAIPGSAVLFEPLHLERVPAARQAGFSWRTYVRPGARWPEGETFLEDVLRGRVLNTWTTRELRRPRRVSTWIVKCIRMNRLLPWLAERFPTRPPLLVIRHPCAVVASQLAAGWETPRERPGPKLLEDFPQVKDVLESLETDEEHRAASWAIDNLVPLSAAQPQKWTTVLYEHLLRDDSEFRRLFDRWGVAPPEDLKEVMSVPSSTAVGSKVASPEGPLTSWTKRLDPARIRRILAVTHALGLDFYGEEPEPDRSRLQRWGVLDRPD